MEYKDFDCGTYKIHLIKTDKFKTCHLEINFRSEVSEDKMQSLTMLSDLLTDSSERFKEKKDLVIYFEELYKAWIYGTTNKTGNVFNTIFISDFIAPEYINEKDYLEKVLSLPFEMILKPNAKDKEFEIKSFNVVKERLKRDIESIEENPTKKTIHEALEKVAPKTSTGKSVMGTLDTLEKITPESLYKVYEWMLKTNLCDIFIIGNLDDLEVKRIINKYFKLKVVKTHELNLYVKNEVNKKANEIGHESEFVQTSLAMIYNILDMDDYEKNIVFHLYNYLLGSGGLTSKLYQSVREKNSLCYNINSMYLKYDYLLLIMVSLDETNREKAIKLISQGVKEMAKGEFTDKDLEDAKKNLLFSLDMTLDNNIAILNNYVFHIFDNLPTLEERKKLIENVNKEDIVNLAKKIKLNTIYYLKGGNNVREN
jgi:predicted Zn-dependent peptidase